MIIDIIIFVPCTQHLQPVPSSTLSSWDHILMSLTFRLTGHFCDLIVLLLCSMFKFILAMIAKIGQRAFKRTECLGAASCVCVCVCACMHAYLHVCVCVCACMPVASLCVCVFVYVHLCEHALSNFFRCLRILSKYLETDSVQLIMISKPVHR